jgi:uncharacterized coiled-coil protein SlyX
MVKLPKFEDLKKMGSDLIDSAKSVKLNEMVDKFKSSIESVTAKKSSLDPSVQDEALEQVFVSIYASLKELADAQAAQEVAVKKIQNQLNSLAKVLEKYQKATDSSTPPTDNEVKKEETK